jgi:hypothetical protein
MPDGMVALLEGKYFWKMPANLRIGTGPTILHPLPKNHMAARLRELSDGGLGLTN